MVGDDGEQTTAMILLMLDDNYYDDANADSFYHFNSMGPTSMPTAN